MFRGVLGHIAHQLVAFMAPFFALSDKALTAASKYLSVMGRRPSPLGALRAMMSRPVGRRLPAWLSVALAALLVAAPMASAYFPFVGTTSQGKPVHFRVSNNELVVKQFVISWHSQCSRGGTFDASTVVHRVVATPYPRFHVSGNYVISAKTYSALVSIHLRGMLPRNAHVHGTWTAQVRLMDTNQNQINSCSTGLVRWHAYFR